ncbi:MAG: DNA double-strand break repair nuclease NurA [Ekhidna sp.]
MDKPIISSFTDILKCLNSNENYKKSPPTGPPDNWPNGIVTSDQFEDLNTNTFGEDPIKNSPNEEETLDLVENDGILPKFVEYPSSDMLEDINISAIDGSNERIERGAFFLILVRSALENFRYNKAGHRPNIYQSTKDVSAMTLADSNIFDRDKLNITTSYRVEEDDDEIRNYIQGHLRSLEKEPIFIKYNRQKNLKSPASHALGWGVKLMQTLELIALKDVDTKYRSICIKDGPIFSPSVSKRDTNSLLSILKSWDNQVLIGCSKRIQDSRLLTQLLFQKGNLRNAWFKGQAIKESSIKSISSDKIILSRILKPGERTPLIKGIPDTRESIVDPNSDIGGDRDYMPLNCYYLSRTKPHTYIRMEIPALFYNKNPRFVEEAISIAAWQHELGRIAPLVQLLADKRCSLSSEKEIMERLTNAALLDKELEFLQDY